MVTAPSSFGTSITITQVRTVPFTLIACFLVSSGISLIIRSVISSITCGPQSHPLAVLCLSVSFHSCLCCATLKMLLLIRSGDPFGCSAGGGSSPSCTGGAASAN